MSKPLEGVRVLEVAAWTFVPAAGAVMADLGADVIKVEPPTGDAQRGLRNMLNLTTSGPNPFNEIPNRGKRSITLDLQRPGGRELLLRIAATSDVFLTSYLPSSRIKLGIDVDDVRAVKPDIVYAKGSGWGPRGDMADTGGFDLASAWATSSLAYRLTDGPDGPKMQPAAFYDLQGGNTIAGAIGTALFRRERTGQGSVVDVSLMHVGMWSMSVDIVAAPFVDQPSGIDRRSAANPITNWYRTADDRWVYLVCLQADRYWRELCDVVGRPDLADDPRFVDAPTRFEHREECIRELDAVFAGATLEEWTKRLDGFSGVWAPAITPRELHRHRQVGPNGYLPELTDNEGVDFRIVPAPMQFDGAATTPAGPSPVLGQHTEEILLEVGLDWDEITAAREAGHLG
ncbi:MAG TPA: CoA transferase [Acidimicrobiia bacterium]|nr:CoA transferase [Acidimicrobiia bacterium]